MASGSVTASTEADIISDMLKKPFSARQSGEQNIIVTQRPMPNLQSTTGDRLGELVHKERLALW